MITLIMMPLFAWNAGGSNTEITEFLGDREF
jgi:hypothetical protein